MLTDQQEEDLLRNYLDHMVELYLQLRASQPADAVRDLAQALTFTTLQRLGAERKGVVVRFLHDAELLAVNQPPIVTLSGANLLQADLHKANLFRAKLRGADLTEADLSNASLTEADLTEAGLNNANLTGADLSNANLTEALQLHLVGSNLS
jgi:Pentapeptide repeats (8 copies)